MRTPRSRSSSGAPLRVTRTRRGGAARVGPGEQRRADGRAGGDQRDRADEQPHPASCATRIDDTGIPADARAFSVETPRTGSKSPRLSGVNREAILSEPMTSYRDLLAAGQVRDRRAGRDRGGRLLELRPPRARSTSASWTSGRRATSRAPCTSRAATSSRRSSRRFPDREQADRRLLRRRLALRLRGEDARRARLRDASTRSPAATPTGSATASPRCCRARSTPTKRSRYSRHLLIPEVGEEGQLKLLDSRMLLIGAGGLGSPASLYLAAAGVGTLGIVDDDVVDATNLQRQIVHSTERLGSLEGRVGQADDRGAQPRRPGAGCSRSD